jgi:7-carboxy-7-deazaguanine synthase
VSAPTPYHLRVSEVFGPTLQGEGPTAGMPCGFIRLGGCNLSCPWCDTPYTWDWSGKNGKAYDPNVELSWRDPSSLLDQVIGMGVDRVVVTGGEPLLQQERLVPLLHALDGQGIKVEVETNGTRVPAREVFRLVHQFNVSPKLGANTGMAREKRIKLDALHELALHPRAAFKFVVGSDEDVREALTVAWAAGLRASQVWLMPLAANDEELARNLPMAAEAAVREGVNLSNRLHVQAWGTKRGV